MVYYIFAQFSHLLLISLYCDFCKVNNYDIDIIIIMIMIMIIISTIIIIFSKQCFHFEMLSASFSKSHHNTGFFVIISRIFCQNHRIFSSGSQDFFVRITGFFLLGSQDFCQDHRIFVRITGSPSLLLCPLPLALSSSGFPKRSDARASSNIILIFLLVYYISITSILY